MACTLRVSRHGYLSFRLYWGGFDVQEGVDLKDTPANRAKMEARAKVIGQEMADGVFDYLRWFPNGALAHRFRPPAEHDTARLLTLRGFFQSWGETSEQKQTRPVSTKWALNRASTIRTNVLPYLGQHRLDDLTPAILTDLQQKLLRKGLKPATVDGIVHSALRGMLRDAKALGYRVVDLATLYDRQFIRRLNLGVDPSSIDAFTEAERDQILDGFRGTHYHAFVCHQLWTGARPGEAIGLRWGNVDLTKRVIRIRVSRVQGRDGRPKTGKSKRDVVIHRDLLAVLQELERGAPDGFVFTTPSGVAINEGNFYRRHWLPMLHKLGLRTRDFYTTRHTYISAMLAAGMNPLQICRQTGTSLDMIQEHYGCVRTIAEELDAVIAAAGRTTALTTDAENTNQVAA